MVLEHASSKSKPQAPESAEGVTDYSTPLLIGKPVGAVVSAARILRYLATINGTVRGSKVAQDLGLNPSTCFNILQTLAAENLVRFDHESKRYRLGYGLLDLASSNAIMGGDLNGIRTAMQTVSDRHDVTMSLWRRISETRMLLIVVTSSARQTRVHMTVGQRLPLLVGSTGRAMAGALRLSEAELQHYFNDVRWIRSVTFEAYCQEVQLAVDRGWALDAGDFVSGLHSLSAPVVDEKGAPLLICTATMFSGQYTPKRGEEIGHALIELSTTVQPMARSLL
jgi:DNA-binding IclR family transcriptional regulator